MRTPIAPTDTVLRRQIDPTKKWWCATSSCRMRSNGPGGSAPRYWAALVEFSGTVTNVNVKLANCFIVINVGGGPTDDKPTVTLETPPDPNRTSSFLNIRVKDIYAKYEEWSAKGAEFLTPPKQHPYEIRCYIRDPDGYLIEVGQTTDPKGDWSPW